jgi:hypothetical protein
MDTAPATPTTQSAFKETVMNKQHFAGFLATLAITALQFYALEAGSATTWADRGNPAVVETATNGSRLAGPAAHDALCHVPV